MPVESKVGSSWYVTVEDVLLRLSYSDTSSWSFDISSCIKEFAAKDLVVNIVLFLVSKE
jgi:hypothetical protein